MAKVRFSISAVCLAVLLATSSPALGHDPEQSSDEKKARPKLHLTGEFNPDDAGSYVAEIAAYDPESKRLFVSDGTAATIRIVDISDPAKPTLFRLVELGDYGEANSVACHNGLVAVAVNNKTYHKPGSIVFLNSDGDMLHSLVAGAMPDMVTFTHDGRYLLVANEGEPNASYSIDPQGTVSIISLNKGLSALGVDDIATVDFAGVSVDASTPYIRIVKPGSTAAEDFEPEYIAISADDRTAYVSLQENNAIAAIDIETASLKFVRGLPFKDHSREENAFDASNKDDGINIRPWPVLGMPQPDTIAIFTAENGNSYLFTANEGDAKDYDGFSEEVRVADLKLDAPVFPNADELRKKKNLGRLKTTTVRGAGVKPEGGYKEILAFGSRSFTVYKIQDDGLTQVYDSGDTFERSIAEHFPDYFNSNNDENDSFDSRSDDKGPEPEALATGTASGVPMLFVGMERVGGIFSFDISNPEQPKLIEYVLDRDFSAPADAEMKGQHVGPEGMLFIPSEKSPSGLPLLVVCHEVSGSVAIYEVR